ncbi:MAG: adenylate kinase [Actinobacteria bacterium]|nr:adenylate kinase [Actinomycetota bacterium]
MQRVSMVGVPGAGKSTTGRLVASLLDVPFVELDSLFHQPGWTPLPLEQFRAGVGEIVAGDGWVVDGNYRQVRDLVWGRADTVIWLDPSRIRATSRVLRRTLERVTRGEELWNGNSETWSNLFSADPERNVVLWSWKKHPEYRRSYTAAMVERVPSEARWVRLRSDDEVDVFLSGLNR